MRQNIGPVAAQKAQTVLPRPEKEGGDQKIRKDPEHYHQGLHPLERAEKAERAHQDKEGPGKLRRKGRAEDPNHGGAHQGQQDTEPGGPRAQGGEEPAAVLQPARQKAKRRTGSGGNVQRDGGRLHQRPEIPAPQRQEIARIGGKKGGQQQNQQHPRQQRQQHPPHAHKAARRGEGRRERDEPHELTEQQGRGPGIDGAHQAIRPGAQHKARIEKAPQAEDREDGSAEALPAEAQQQIGKLLPGQHLRKQTAHGPGPAHRQRQRRKTREPPGAPRKLRRLHRKEPQSGRQRNHNAEAQKLAHVIMFVHGITP